MRQNIKSTLAAHRLRTSPEILTHMVQLKHVCLDNISLYGVALLEATYTVDVLLSASPADIERPSLADRR